MIVDSAFLRDNHKNGEAGIGYDPGNTFVAGEKPVDRNESEEEIEPLRSTFSNYKRLISGPEYDRISRSKEIELGGRISRAGAKGVRDVEAENRLSKANLGLVISFAKLHCNSKLDLMGLVQEGNLGLMRAASDYDGQEDFGDYASSWIRNAIQDYVRRQTRIENVPEDVYFFAHRVNKLIWKRGERGESVELDSLYGDLQERDQLLVRNKKQISLDTFVQIMTDFNRSRVDLEGEDSSSFGLEGIREDAALNDENLQGMFGRDFKRFVGEVICDPQYRLSEKERIALLHRLDLNGGQILSCEEIAERFDFGGASNVSAHVANGKKKLRKKVASKRLRSEYYGL
jgi:RNA polymerase sigma factor (sigma-70 family)